MSFLISGAFAADEGVKVAASSESNPLSVIVMLVAFGLIFYFMILRPQQKRSKEHKKLMSSIEKDEEVLTSGGLVGRVVKISESGFLTIALNDTTEVVVRRDFVAAVLPKGTIEKM